MPDTGLVIFFSCGGGEGLGSLAPDERRCFGGGFFGGLGLSSGVYTWANGDT